MYVLYINPMLGTAHYGLRSGSFAKKIGDATIGTIYDCSERQLKRNIQYLKGKGYQIIKRD